MVWADDVDDVQLGAGAVGQVHGGTEGQFRLRGTIGGQYYLHGEDAHLRLRSDVVVGPHCWLEPRACTTWGVPLPLFARFREASRKRGLRLLLVSESFRSRQLVFAPLQGLEASGSFPRQISYSQRVASVVLPLRVCRRYARSIKLYLRVIFGRGEYNQV